MAAAAILKNRNIAIFQPWLDRFWRNLAYWRSSNFLTIPTVKTLKFLKSKMAAAAILKNRKIEISRPQLDRFQRDLALWRNSTLLTVPTVKNLKFQKSKMAEAAILKIEKSLYLGRSSSDFDEFWPDDTVRPSLQFRPLKIWNFKNRRWRRPPSRIIKNHHMSAGIRAILVEIWHSEVVRLSWRVRPIKIYKF